MIILAGSFLAFMGMVRSVVNVIAHFAEAFIITEDVFDVKVIASHSFNFVRQDAIRTRFWSADRWCLFVSFLARS